MTGLKNFSIKHKNKNWPKILIGAVALLFLVVILGFLSSPIKNYFYKIFHPIQEVFWSAGQSSSSFLGSFLGAGALFSENQNLQHENQQLLSQVAALQSLVQGNQAQSDVSQSCQNTGFKLLMVGVAGLDDNDILSINKGSSDGVAEGMPVISQQGVLFGKVLRVYKDFSQVMLISNKNSAINVKIQQGDDVLSEIDGILRGSGEQDAYLDLIPISDAINLQDVLVTSAIEKSFPKDLLVGKIVQKKTNDQKPFQQAEIDLFFNVRTTDNLFVITNYKQIN